MVEWLRPLKCAEYFAPSVRWEGLGDMETVERALYAGVTAGEIRILYRGRVMPSWARERLLPAGKSFDRTDFGLPPNIELSVADANRVLLNTLAKRSAANHSDS